MTATATDIRDWKLSRAFAYYDVNNDGYIDRDDFQALAAQMSSRLKPGDPVSAALRKAWGRWWEAIVACHQGSKDRLNASQWIAAVKALRDEEGHEQIVIDALEGLFRFIDADSNDKFDVAEFERFYASAGSSSERAREAFARLDRDGDAHISRAEFMQACIEYYFSSQPDVPGNWLLGPPDGPEPAAA